MLLLKTTTRWLISYHLIINHSMCIATAHYCVITGTEKLSMFPYSGKQKTSIATAASNNYVFACSLSVIQKILQASTVKTIMWAFVIWYALKSCVYLSVVVFVLLQRVRCHCKRRPISDSTKIIYNYFFESNLVVLAYCSDLTPSWCQ